MKIDIASSGNNINALLSDVLARSPWMAFYDTNTRALEFLPNPFAYKENEVGKEVLQLLVSNKVSLVISRKVQKKNFKHKLDAGRIIIALYNLPLTIRQIIKLLERKSSKA